MYRTEKLAKKLKKHPIDLDPICIASYARPDAILFKELCKNDIYRGSFLFVRKEEYKDYEQWSEFFHIVTLKNVDNVGDTRKKVIKYCIKQGMDNIYLLDDDINELQYLIPSVTANGTECMRTFSVVNQVKKSVDPIAIMMWQYIIKEKCKEDVVISAPIYRPFSWNLKHKNSKLVYNSGDCIQCVRLNVKLLYDNHINYRSTKLVGPSDYAIQFECMEKGLKTLLLKDIEYGAKAMGEGTGGCSASEYDVLFNGDMNKIMEDRYNRFITNVCGKDHPGIRTKITQKTKRISPAFNWKYWRSLNE